MAERLPQTDVPRGLTGASAIWESPLVGGWLDEAYFVAEVTDSIYKGAQSVATRYLGTRTEAQLYLGAGNLWP